MTLPLSSCSSDDGPETQGSNASASSASASASASDQGQPSSSTSPAPSGNIGVSPGGVTTAVDAGAESLEEEYFQACHAAKIWMAAQGSDPQTLVEPYLASIQSTDSAGPGTFGTPWSQLTPGRQAAVIVAVEAAADGLCA
ncbi:MAG: lipoprotein LpqV [Mycobacterium sp.]